MTNEQCIEIVVERAQARVAAGQNPSAAILFTLAEGHGMNEREQGVFAAGCAHILSAIAHAPDGLAELHLATEHDLGIEHTDQPDLCDRSLSALIRVLLLNEEL